MIRFGDRIYVQDMPKLKKSILEECCSSGLSVHLGTTKMCQDLRKMLWR